jgi:hypothetical protein
MLETVRCNTCENDRARKDMSPIDGLCRACFDEFYCLCAVCGKLLTRPPYPGGNRFANPPHRMEDGDPICYDCCCFTAATNRWNPTPLDVSITTYDRVGSKRKYGVEIETEYCRGYETLLGNTKFGCKTDCSIGGREFDSPILYGDAGFEEIEALLDYAERRNWQVDRYCGCHTHYDMRDETNEELFRIAYAYAKTYNFWAACVSYERENSNYCEAPSYECCDVRRGFERGDGFLSFVCAFDRYDYVNIGAYGCHKTIEVRLLEGTVDAGTICNWIAIHARFMDYVKNHSFDDLDLILSGDRNHVLIALTHIVGDADLMAWLANRIENRS